MIIGKDRQPTPPGEWEVDENGRRFRYDGRCIEYETQVFTSHGTLTQRQLDAMNAREKEKPAFTYTPTPPPKSCPLKGGPGFLCSKEDCAWYTETGCAQTCPHPAAGRKCPHTNAKCTYTCALRKDCDENE